MTVRGKAQHTTLHNATLTHPPRTPPNPKPYPLRSGAVRITGKAQHTTLHNVTVAHTGHYGVVVEGASALGTSVLQSRLEDLGNPNANPN